jgi:hypothetical protein
LHVRAPGSAPTLRHSQQMASAAAAVELPTASVPPAVPSPAVPHVPKRKKLAVADLLALKGQRQLVLCTAFDEWTARAAEEAGVDMIVAWGENLQHSKMVIAAVRRGAPHTLIGSGINPEAYISVEKAIETAIAIRAAGTDIIYCSGLVPDKFAGLARQHFPCCGHVGYLPCNDTWFGGPRAVGKTAVEAKKIYDDVMALEAAGVRVIAATDAKEMLCTGAAVVGGIRLVATVLALALWPSKCWRGGVVMMCWNVRVCARPCPPTLRCPRTRHAVHRGGDGVRAGESGGGDHQAHQDAGVQHG